MGAARKNRGTLIDDFSADLDESSLRIDERRPSKPESEQQVVRRHRTRIIVLPSFDLASFAMLFFSSSAFM